MVEHGGVGRLQAREQALLALGHIGPGAHGVVARRHARALRDDAERDLAGEPLLALDVPAMGEQRVVFLDQVERRLVRRVAGAQRHPGQPRRLLVVGDVVGEIADGLVDQIGGQVIARGEVAGRIDRRVVAHQLGRVLVGLGVHEAVVAVEAAAERPAVERAGGAGLGERRHMPLAQHVVAIAVRAQHLGHACRPRARSCRDSPDSPNRSWRGSRRPPNDGCGRSAGRRAWSSTSPWCGSRCSAGRGRRWRRWSGWRWASRSSRSRRSRHRRTG